MPFEQKGVPATLLRDGEKVELFVDVTYLPLIGRSGEVEGVISFTYDVTAAERIKIKAEETAERLRLAYEDLEVKVKFRNMELERRNLELEETNRKLIEALERRNKP